MVDRSMLQTYGVELLPLVSGGGNSLWTRLEDEACQSRWPLAEQAASARFDRMAEGGAGPASLVRDGPPRPPGEPPLWRSGPSAARSRGAAGCLGRRIGAGNA